MKRQINKALNALLASAGIAVILGLSQARADGATRVLPPHSNAYGKSYGEWSAAWWQWFMEHPLTGHPGVDSPDFDVSSGQEGKVWFLAGVFGTVERTVTIPTGKAIFVALANAEASDLEGLGATEAEQRATAAWTADHIVSVSCSIDGIPVDNLDAFRVQSPQFGFTAPDPWIFSPAPGGTGTSVADGYFVMLSPLSKGAHTLHITGAYHFSIAEGDPFDGDFSFGATYHINSGSINSY